MRQKLTKKGWISCILYTYIIIYKLKHIKIKQWLEFVDTITYNFSKKKLVTKKSLVDTKIAKLKSIFIKNTTDKGSPILYEFYERNQHTIVL